MTEDDTFRILQRTPYSVIDSFLMSHSLELVDLIEYLESNHWTWVEYLRAVYDSFSRDEKSSQTWEEFSTYWLDEYFLVMNMRTK